MKRTVFLFMAALLVFGAAALCMFQVNEGEFAIVSRFGDPRQVLEAAGLYFKAPPPIDTVVRVDRRIHVLDPPPSEYLTSDKKNVLVSSFMAWSVEDPIQFYVSVNDLKGAEARLTDIMNSEVGTLLGAHELSVLVQESGSTSDKVLSSVTEQITSNAARKAKEAFGIKVWVVRFRRLNFPLQNKEAVFRRMEAERQRIAMKFRSEGEEEAGKIRAQADRERATLVAEAKRKAEEIRASADAESTKIYADAFGADPQFFEFLRSLETYESIFRENSTVVIPSDSRVLRVMQEPDSLLSPRPVPTP